MFNYLSEMLRGKGFCLKVIEIMQNLLIKKYSYHFICLVLSFKRNPATDFINRETTVTVTVTVTELPRSCINVGGSFAPHH